jgi:uncharacterized alpha-E superfamily protein
MAAFGNLKITDDRLQSMLLVSNSVNGNLADNAGLARDAALQLREWASREEWAALHSALLRKLTRRWNSELERLYPELVLTHVDFRAVLFELHFIHQLVDQENSATVI